MSNYPTGPGQPQRPYQPPPFAAGDERTTMLPPGGYRPGAPAPDDRTTVLPQGYPRPSAPPGWSPAPNPAYPGPPPGYPPPGYAHVPPAPAPPPASPSRRGVLIGAGVAVVAAAGGFATYAAVRPSTKGSAPPAGTDATTSAAAAAGGAVLAKVADIPEQGGVVLAEEKIVLTRPTGQTVKAFTAVCTHQGCLVATVSAGAIHCPCHGSAFDASTGAVVNGPASQPLAPIGITVADGVVRKG